MAVREKASGGWTPGLLILLFSAPLTVVGCQGSGSDPDSMGQTTPPPKNPMVGLFAPDRSGPGENTLILSGATSGEDLDLIVRANSVSAALAGAAFDLVFDPENVTYVGYSAGDFFERAGAVTYGVAPRSDRLIVGVAAGPLSTGAGGSGNVVTLHFRAKATGRSGIAFDNQALCSVALTTACDRQPSLSWYGGTYSVS